MASMAIKPKGRTTAIPKTAAEWMQTVPGMELETAKKLEANPPKPAQPAQGDKPPAPHVFNMRTKDALKTK